MTKMLIDGPRVAPASDRAATSLVVLVHGYGSNGADLIGLVPYWQAALPDTAFSAPNAPEPLPGYAGGFQWWSLESLAPDERAAGVRRAGPALDAFLDAELERLALTPDRLALVGFSQGTMVALQVGPMRRTPIAGIVGYSGMIADPAGLAAGVKSRPPVLLVHGEADDRIPLPAYGQAMSVLQGLGFAVEGHVSRGLGHSIDLEGLKLGEGFLRRHLSLREREGPGA